MRGLMRFLMMFGPMLFRQYQKYQAKKEREAMQQRSRLPQQQSNQRTNRNYTGTEQAKDGRYYRGSNEPVQQQRRQEPQRPAPISEDERNFKMEEDEFMLDPNTEAEYNNEMKGLADNRDQTQEQLSSSKEEFDIDFDSPQESANNNPASNNSPIERSDDDGGFSIKDLFIKPEEGGDADA